MAPAERSRPPLRLVQDPLDNQDPVGRLAAFMTWLQEAGGLPLTVILDISAWDERR